MKAFKEVQETRKKYHANPLQKSVHRSSLLVPEIPGSKAEISFLNHFLVKRGYKKVGCRITGVNPEGKRIESLLYSIEEPRVYTFTLSDLFKEPTASYIVEFFSSENLFIPFPAVMVNHRGPGYLSQVHSYNRVLNDVFEDDEINTVRQRETAIDFTLDDSASTFLVFMAGMAPCRGSIGVELQTSDGKYSAAQEIDLPRFGTQKIDFRKLFPKVPSGTRAIVRVDQPSQSMFYGRLLVGQLRTDGAFSANHSYYDNGNVAEYWEDKSLSRRDYPFFKQFQNIIRFYPTLSPSTLGISIDFNDIDGKKIAEYPVGDLICPGVSFLEANVTSALKKIGVDPERVQAFSVVATPKDGRSPTRVNHQVVYQAGGLETSIAEALFNRNIFVAPNKKSFTWGQSVMGGGFHSMLAITGGKTYDPNRDYETQISFYGPEGKIADRKWQIKAGSSHIVDLAAELAAELKVENLDPENPTYIWFTAESPTYGLTSCNVTYHEGTRHSSGEHGF
jgi:hypothetical protein